MRRHGLVLLCTLGLAALAAAVATTMAGAHSTPQIRAEQAHERAVIAQVNAIGRDLQLAEDEAQNAQNRLALAHVDFIRGRQFYGQASHLLKGAAKKARKLARTGRLAPDCAGALNRNLLEASGRLAALRQAL